MKILSTEFRVLLVVLLLCSGFSGAQQPGNSAQKTEPSVTFEQVRELMREIDGRVRAARASGNELTVMDTLRALEAEYAAKGPAARLAISTQILTVAPELGDYREALRHGDIVMDLQPIKPNTSGRTILGQKTVSAISALSRAAARSRVVMINEAHHVPQHRAFTIELLKALRKRGFTHFASETLYESDTRLNERGYPTKDTGFYTREPVYGDLIRTALKLGYRVVAYEATGVTNPDERERGQARNLFERIVKDNPKAKVLVHAGYSHIEESGSLVGAPTMAQRFKEMTGIDPLTIDQAEMSERGDVLHEHSLYRSAEGSKLIPIPTVLLTPEGDFWSLDKSRWDVTLFLPRSRYTNGRPDWLRLGGTRTPYRLPRDICGEAGRCLVRARFVKELADALPVDQVEVSRNDQIPDLMLPRGEFEVVIENPSGKLIKSFRVRSGRR